MRGGDLPRRIGRAVVHQDHLIIRVIKPFQRVQTGLERALAVVAGHHDRDLRAARQRETRCRAKRLLHGPKRRLLFFAPPLAPPFPRSSIGGPPPHRWGEKVTARAPPSPPRKALSICHP